MREIKFRFKVPNSDQFIYKSLVDLFKPSGDSVAMQYTGLKDKNGKEIYEGDIARFREYNHHINFSDGGFYVGDFDTLGSINTAVEIIGNIYENPELLKEPI